MSIKIFFLSRLYFTGVQVKTHPMHFEFSCDKCKKEEFRFVIHKKKVCLCLPLRKQVIYSYLIIRTLKRHSFTFNAKIYFFKSPKATKKKKQEKIKSDCHYRIFYVGDLANISLLKRKILSHLQNGGISNICFVNCCPKKCMQRAFSALSVQITPYV